LSTFIRTVVFLLSSEATLTQKGEAKFILSGDAARTKIAYTTSNRKYAWD
jgi:hypothetical protein